MGKEINKILYKVLPFVLCLCIVSGSVDPAYASSNTGLYDQAIYNNTNNLVTDVSNIWGLVNNITNILNSYITTANSFFNAWSQPTYLPNSLLNQLHNDIVTFNNNYVNNSSNLSKLTDIYNSVVAINADTYTIDSNVDNIYTWVMAIGQALAAIQTDVSGIKTDTANLSGIKTDTSNLSGIKTDTSFIDDIYNSLYDNSYYNMISILNRAGQGNISDSYPSANVFPGQYNPLNVSYISADSIANTYKIKPGGTGNQRSIYTMLGYTNTNLLSLFSALYSLNTVYRVQKLDYTDGIPSFDSQGLGWNYSYSIADQLHFMNVNIADFFSRIGFVIADPDTIAAKTANKNQEQTVLNNFTGSGAASASVSDFGAVKDSMVDIKAGFNGGASSSDTFSFLSGDSNAWDWFTQDTANDLDRTQRSNTRLLRSSSDVASDTPLLDSYYTSILSILGGDE